MSKKKSPPSTFRRTEGNYTYIYGKFIASSFSKWAAIRRNHEADAFFFDFYNMIPDEEKATITVTSSLKKEAP